MRWSFIIILAMLGVACLNKGFLRPQYWCFGFALAAAVLFLTIVRDLRKNRKSEAVSDAESLDAKDDVGE